MADFKRVLLATDFSPISQKAHEYAETLSQKFKAELHVVHVFDQEGIQIPAPYYFLIGVEQWLEEHVEKARKTCRDLLQEIKNQTGDHTHTHLIEGRAGREIIQFAQDSDIDLIVMGTHGYRGLDRLVMGSVAEWVMRHAPCPVLTVREVEKE